MCVCVCVCVCVCEETASKTPVTRSLLLLVELCCPASHAAELHVVQVMTRHQQKRLHQWRREQGLAAVEVCLCRALVCQ